MQILIKWYLQSARVVHYYMTPYSKGFNALLVQDSADGREKRISFSLHSLTLILALALLVLRLEAAPRGYLCSSPMRFATTNPPYSVCL